jgi:3'-phosphoadenosine 5'-phosphosulfate sulfotransferase
MEKKNNGAVFDAVRAMEMRKMTCCEADRLYDSIAAARASVRRLFTWYADNVCPYVPGTEYDLEINNMGTLNACRYIGPDTDKCTLKFSMEGEHVRLDPVFRLDPADIKGANYGWTDGLIFGLRASIDNMYMSLQHISLNTAGVTPYVKGMRVRLSDIYGTVEDIRFDVRKKGVYHILYVINTEENGYVTYDEDDMSAMTVCDEKETV